MPAFDLSRFRGIFPAAMTFFDAAGNLDEETTVAHWQWLAQRPIDGLVIAGTSGEFVTLSMQEQQRLVQLACTEFAGRFPIIAGTGHAATKYTVEMSQRAQDAGADAFIVILPYYLRPTKAAVFEHYRVLRRNTDRPIMLYNNPGNTACAPLCPTEIATLVEEDVVHMVKSTMESVVPVHDLSYLAGDTMRIFYGSFLSAFEALAGGAHGWISGVLNIVTDDAIEMYRAVVVDKDLERGRQLWRRILPIVHLYTHGQLGPVADIPIYREILNQMGRQGGYSRGPTLPLTVTQREQVRTRLHESGWLKE